MMSQPTHLAQVYNQLANSWSRRLDRLRYPEAYRGLFQRLVQRGVFDALAPSANVMDAGIGTGAFSVAMVDVVGRNIRVHGLDVSQEMLLQAGRALGHKGVSARLHCGTSAELPAWKTGRFDMLISGHMLEHSHAPQEEIKRLAQLLKPGAPLLLVVTREGWAYRLLSLKWRLQGFTLRQLASWLLAADCVEVEPVEFGARGTFARFLGVAVLAKAGAAES